MKLIYIQKNIVQFLVLFNHSAVRNLENHAKTVIKKVLKLVLISNFFLY
jgi:hypothetical protein